MKKILFTVAIFLAASLLVVGQSTKVLFIGNSYTGVNNLPQMTYDAALSVGDTLIVDNHTPGGQRLLNHASSPQALAKINSQDWDYVVLQAQSQEPSWPIGQVQTEVFPYATQLCDQIRANNSCSMPVFYMTWGRKNGDAGNCASWPPVCTYVGMDSLLNERYRTMAIDNNALVSPVGAAWHYIRDNFASIELYDSDESHPSVAGSYAAACTFYAVFLRKDPSLISYSAGLNSKEAENIRNAVKLVVYDDLSEWNIGKYDPVADFYFTKNQYIIDFNNQSKNAVSFFWDFGDGNTSVDENPQNTYAILGQYEVKLEATFCSYADLKLDTVEFSLGLEQVESSKISLHPNPSCRSITIDLSSDMMSREFRVQVYSLAGKLVLDKPIVNGQIIFSVANFSPGLYTYKIGSNTGNFVVE